jgi:hypothetical protein
VRSRPSTKSRRREDQRVLCRPLRLTLLAPDAVEAILDGRQPAGLTLAVLMRPFSVVWREQQMAFGFCPGTFGRCFF